MPPPGSTRLEIARHSTDCQWQVTLRRVFSRPAASAIHALADTIEHVLDAGDGDGITTLLQEAGYIVDVTVSADADAFAVTVTVWSPDGRGGRYVLDLDTHFELVPKSYLRDVVRRLR